MTDSVAVTPHKGGDAEKNAIEIRGLCKKYKGFELKNVDITLPRGYIMGFIGENGAGKTTTIKAMLDIINIDEGTVNIMGAISSPSRRQDKAVREHIGVVMDDTGFPQDASYETVQSIMSSCYKTWDRDKFNSLMKRFGLPAGKKIKEYSKGMRMKLSIAAALSHDCRLLILDEATSGLDPIVRDEMLDIFREFIQDESHSVFLSSHILSDLEKICDYITFIHEGHIVFSESKESLAEKYGILKCSLEALEDIDPSAVVSYRRTEFNVEALVKREEVNPAFAVEDVGIEDIMIYFVREEKQ